MPSPRRRISAFTRVPGATVTFRGPSSVGHLDLSSEHQGRKGKLHPHHDVVALAGEDLVLGHRQDDVEIARGAAVGAGVALARQAQARSRLDTGRDLERELLLGPLPPLARARLAGFLDDRAVPAAARAGARHDQEALRDALAAPPAAHGAGLRPSAGLRAACPHSSRSAPVGRARWAPGRRKPRRGRRSPSGTRDRFRPSGPPRRRPRRTRRCLRRAPRDPRSRTASKPPEKPLPVPAWPNWS